MAETLPLVTVLLSTYNGAQYLAAQVDSILAQQGVQVQLRIRDDGSADETAQLLHAYAQHENVTVAYGQNEGWKASFTDLMHAAPVIPDSFYAFADQDDVWHPDKLAAAVAKLADQTTPMVYHGNVAIMDGDMQFLGNRFAADFDPNQHFPESFLDGWGVGATMVFNATMLRLIQKYHPTQATNHDALVMALGNLLGTVVYDPKAHISYRRHAGTATGFGQNASAIKPTLMDRYRRYSKGPKHQFSVRAAALLAGWQSQLAPEQIQVLTAVASYRQHFGAKLRLLFDPRFRASGARKTLQVKYRVLMNTL
ncbi:glycosyltransferase [Lacticaseibacillus baoqingensis]|uniref:Glycosyltransferase n=1 Tax=Lacticaseibacillus baoqingensis TaxID=2486013 RepID=A0ABW4E4R9_9LACO|nr:glycosyltransferase [Lacticaseibacillus baoqingensis]